ncbi:MAG TPA: protoglobin domain-containing protein [Pseudonocardiaceae bacterium]|nr:protoglobin domain-containing protein [Pseudonocardiaceae bacterium]
MTTSNEMDYAQHVEDFSGLVTPDFAPLADFAGFRGYEAVAVHETSRDLAPLMEMVTADISGYLASRPESTALLTGSGSEIDASLIREWLDRTAAGPFDGELSAFLREITHLPDSQVTFPGMRVPLPPQMLLALIAWVQGKVLEALGDTCDVVNVSAAGGAWMTQFMLQLGIMLEPQLTAPDAPQGQHQSAGFHPYAELAGLGVRQQRILRKTGPLLEPAGGGVVAMAYDYLLSRPESAGYFQDATHLAMRKQTLKGWWARSTTRPMDEKFHSYMSRVADAHVNGGGQSPHVVIPPELTIALMGWVQMRVMAALNTIAPDHEGGYIFGTMPEPPEIALIGAAWMQMLTLQLGILLKPNLPAPSPADNT